jgi:hypothetical protein
VGWVNPTISYEQMRQIDASARELNALVTANVIRPVFKASWSEWYGRWRAFFDKYQSDYAKLGALFSTDALYAQVQGFSADLVTYQDGYAKERDADGKPLPASVTPAPKPVDPNAPPPPTSGMPWWGWLLIGGGTLTVGYLAYLAYKGAKREGDILAARGRALEGGLSKMLPGPFGEAYGAAGHDPAKTESVSEKVTLILTEPK